MAERTGRLSLFIIVATLSAGLVSGCSTTISGKSRPNGDDLRAHQEQVQRDRVEKVTTKACKDFREATVQVIRSINDFVKTYNDGGGYSAPNVDSKITTVVETVDKWSGTVRSDLVPDVASEVSAPLDTWVKAATGVRDSVQNREDDSLVNDRTHALNAAKDTVRTACAQY